LSSDLKLIALAMGNIRSWVVELCLNRIKSDNETYLFCLRSRDGLFSKVAAGCRPRPVEAEAGFVVAGVAPVGVSVVWEVAGLPRREPKVGVLMILGVSPGLPRRELKAGVLVILDVSPGLPRTEPAVGVPAVGVLMSEVSLGLKSSVNSARGYLLILTRYVQSCQFSDCHFPIFLKGCSLPSQR